MSKMANKEIHKILLTAIVIGIFGGTLFVFADSDLPRSLPTSTATPRLTEAYNGTTIPNRDQYSTAMPNIPFLSNMNPTVARQQGAQTLQSVNLDEASDRQNVRRQVGGMSGESTNPGGNSSSPFSSFSPPAGVTTTQVGGGSSGVSGSQRSSSPADPLGGNASSGEDAQSPVSRNGGLPSGAVGATQGDPVKLGSLIVDRFSRDVMASWYNALAAMTALRTQIVNRQTQRIADKIDAVNDTHRSLNQNISDLVSTMNQVLVQLPTIPGS